MRLLHTADLHLGKILHEQSLLDDQAEVLDKIATELETNVYDLFVVAGDVYDRSVPPPEAIVLWDRFLSRIRESCPKLAIIIIPGNHDSAARMSFGGRLLNRQNIYLITDLRALEAPLELELSGERWQVYGVPFLNAGSLSATQDRGENAVLRSQRDLWRQALDRMAQTRSPEVKAILVTHLFTVGGSETDSERLFVGEAEQIPGEWLKGWDYVALGHLHQKQEPERGVWYSGSPYPYSFSEAGQPKVALSWDETQVHEIPLQTRRGLVRLEGTLADLEKGRSEAAGQWVEATLTDAVLVPGALERLRQTYPGLLSLVQGPSARLSQEMVETPLAQRRTGNLVADTLRFLEDVGETSARPAESELADFVREFSHEAS